VGEAAVMLRLGPCDVCAAHRSLGAAHRWWLPAPSRAPLLDSAGSDAPWFAPFPGVRTK